MKFSTTVATLSYATPLMAAPFSLFGNGFGLGSRMFTLFKNRPLQWSNICTVGSKGRVSYSGQAQAQASIK